MPRMGGIELSHILLEKHPTMKILFISGYTDDLLGEHSVLSEGMSFMQKPFSPQEIVYKVRAVLDS